MWSLLMNQYATDGNDNEPKGEISVGGDSHSGLDEENWDPETSLVKQEYFCQSTHFWFLQEGLKLDLRKEMTMKLERRASSSVFIDIVDSFAMKF